MPPKKKKLGRAPIKKEEKMAESDNNKSRKVSSIPYACESCKKCFPSKARLKRHKTCCKQTLERNKNKLHIDVKKIVTVQKPAYTCGKCNKKFKFLKSYRDHKSLVHSKDPNSIQCKRCPARVPDKEALEKHIQKEHDREVFECPHCCKKFTRNYHVLRHMEQKACNGSPPVTPFVCEICNFSFTRKDNLLYHLRHHLVEKAYKCKLCPFEAITLKKLLVHSRNVHSEKRFECDHCGQVTGSRIAIAKHLKTHGEKEFACDLCGYMTYTIEVMQRHVLCHTSDKPFKCELCPRSFIQVGQLRTHTATHHSSNTCTLCDETFKNKFSLTVHMRSHEGLGQLHCPHKNCRNSKIPFAYEESLTKHLLSHGPDKPFACQVCRKRFHFEVNMKRHVSTHMLDRPRRCMYCVSARAYIRGEMLVRHVRTRHPDIFREHLASVRLVLGFDESEARVRRSEVESMILRLDALQDKVLEEGELGKVLYGGMEETKEAQSNEAEEGPLMSEDELVESLGKLLTQLIDFKTLKYFGWPEETVDEVLGKVIEQCGQRVADRKRWSRVQCLRENTKHLFLHVIEDETIARMLSTHTIDQVVRHILNVSQ